MVSLLSGLIAQTRKLNPSLDEVKDGVPTIKGLEAVFENIISVVLGFGAIAVFIMLLVGGLKFLTSGGDPKAIEGAKKTLTFAIGGIVLLVLSYLFLVFIEQFTGVEVTKFKIFFIQ